MKGVLYADGGSNSFGSILCVMTDLEAHKWAYVKRFDKKYNVMQIEYLALISALEKASPQLPLIYTDNLRISKEIGMRYLPQLASKNKMLWKIARKIYQKKPYVKVRWISRTQNLAGIYLEEILWKKKEEKFGLPRNEIEKIYRILSKRKQGDDYFADNH